MHREVTHIDMLTSPPHAWLPDFPVQVHPLAGPPWLSQRHDGVGALMRQRDVRAFMSRDEHGFVLTHINTQIQHANRAVDRLLRVTSPLLIGMPMLMFIHPREWRAVAAAIDRALAAGGQGRAYAAMTFRPLCGHIVSTNVTLALVETGHERYLTWRVRMRPPKETR